MKKSKKGKLVLFKNEFGEFVTVEHAQSDEKLNSKCFLRTVFVDGKLNNETNLDQIRKRADSSLSK